MTDAVCICGSIARPDGTIETPRDVRCQAHPFKALTPEQIRAAIAAAEPGADELYHRLRGLSDLSPAQWSRRLR